MKNSNETVNIETSTVTNSTSWNTKHSCIQGKKNLFHKKKHSPHTRMECQFAVLLIYLHFEWNIVHGHNIIPLWDYALAGFLYRLAFFRVFNDSNLQLKPKIKNVIINHNGKSSYINGKIVLQTYPKLFVRVVQLDLQFVKEKNVFSSFRSFHCIMTECYAGKKNHFTRNGERKQGKRI